MEIYCARCGSDIGLQTNEEYDDMKRELQKEKSKNEKLELENEEMRLRLESLDK
jgi:regulator of replication initiation timing